MRWQPVLVVGALGALAYYVYLRSRPSTVPAGAVGAGAPAPAVAGILNATAWLQSDPLGWLVRGRQVEQGDLDDLA